MVAECAGWASARLVRDLDIKRYDITVCYS